MAAPEMEHVPRQPHPRLRPFVSSYTGYRMAGFEFAGTPPTISMADESIPSLQDSDRTIDDD